MNGARLPWDPFAERVSARRGRCLEFPVEPAVGHADAVAARLIKREGERARDNARLQVQAGNRQLPAAVSGRTVPTRPIATALCIIKRGGGGGDIPKGKRPGPVYLFGPQGNKLFLVVLVVYAIRTDFQQSPVGKSIVGHGIIREAIVALWRPGLAVDEAAKGAGAGLGRGGELVERVEVVLFALAQAQQGGQQ